MKALISGIGIFVFGFLLLRGHDGMITTHYSSLQLIGETVTISYVANPSIGYGQFRLENHGTTRVMASVQSVWLELGEHQHLLSAIKVFDLNQDQMVSPEGFEVDGSEKLTFMVGFPKVDHNPTFGESIAVELQLNVNGDKIQAKSPIKFERRIPLHPTRML